MLKLSTQQVAKKLGIGMATLTRYIQAKKVPAPEAIMVGAMRVRLWSEKDIDRVRALLPRIANGRKTRYQKKQLAVSTQHSAKAKAKKTQPRAAVPHKNRKGKPAPKRSKP